MEESACTYNFIESTMEESLYILIVLLKLLPLWKKVLIVLLKLLPIWKKVSVLTVLLNPLWKKVCTYSFIEITTTMMEGSTNSFIEVTTTMEESSLYFY